MLSILATLTLALTHAAPQDVQPAAAAGAKGTNPILLDRTGIRWAGSFQEALEQARSEKRLLFLMPDNCAPSDNGAIGPECFRAGALCDERIAALIDLRFVPYYFNCFQETAAFDAQALAFVIPEKKEFGEEEQTFFGGIPVLLMTPQGKLVGEAGSYASCDDVLSELQRALKKNPTFDAPSAAEKAAQDPLEKARFLLARGDLDEAEGAVRKVKSPDALALRVKIARLSRDWKRHAKLLGDLAGAGAEGDAAVERAWALLADRDYEEAAEALRSVDSESPRSDEARYLEGLACCGAGDRARALGVWKALIEGREQGPWIYRADWAYCNVAAAGSAGQGASPGPGGPQGGGGAAGAGAHTSLLGRWSYPGPRNPDLPEN